METRQELLAFVAKDPALQVLTREAIKNGTDDAAHNLSHFHRVALCTLALDPSLNPRHVIAAALLHDLVNLPKNSPYRHRASELSSDRAKELLPELGFTPNEVQLIADAIRDHSYSRGAIPESSLGKALQDADRLEALGAIGIMRVFSTGVRLNAQYFHEEDPWANNRSRNDSQYSVDHFFEKLLKLPATMNTPGGREEARHRCEIMIAFLGQLGKEIGDPLPSSLTRV